MNRAVMAARASKRPPKINKAAPTLLPLSQPTATGHVKKTRCAPMTRAMKSADGGRSLWTASPYYWTDPKWSA